MCNRKGYKVFGAQAGQENASATSGERQKHLSALYVESQIRHREFEFEILMLICYLVLEI